MTQFNFERRIRQSDTFLTYFMKRFEPDLIFLPPLIPYAHNPSLIMLSYTVPHPLTPDIVFPPPPCSRGTKFFTLKNAPPFTYIFDNEPSKIIKRLPRKPTQDH